MSEEMRICAFVDCDREFKPKHFNQVYCCIECRMDDKKWKARQKRLRKTIDTTAKFSPVNAYIKQHYEETGEWLSYGKAVVLMEQKKGRSRK